MNKCRMKDVLKTIDISFVCCVFFFVIFLFELYTTKHSHCSWYVKCQKNKSITVANISSYVLRQSVFFLSTLCAVNHFITGINRLETGFRISLPRCRSDIDVSYLPIFFLNRFIRLIQTTIERRTLGFDQSNTT